MINWAQINKSPVCKEVHDYILKALMAKRAGRTFHLMEFIRSFVEGNIVLDIGVVEHDIGHIESKNWKHKSIAEWSKSVLGIDILSEELEILINKGFNVACVDATSEVDLGKRFDRIVIGDVIEHVSEPVKLLEFANRHITETGKILVSTPNPFWIRYIWRDIRLGTFVSNAEHVAWISPSMALELGRRAGLELDEYWLLQSHGNTVLKKIFHYTRDIFLENSELLTPAFLYLYKKSKSNKKESAK